MRVRDLFSVAISRSFGLITLPIMFDTDLIIFPITAAAGGPDTFSLSNACF